MTSSPRKRHQRLTAAGVLLVVGLLLLYVGGSKSNESAAVRATRLSSANHLRIAFGDPKDFFVPPYASTDALLPHVDAQAADEASAGLALMAIETALKAYPDGFVAKLIGGIFIAGELRVGGAVAGGTVGPAWILLAAPARLGREGIYATSLIGVHHELSSFVYRKRPETANGWKQFTPAGWTYKQDPRDVLALASRDDPSPETGFLSAYGTSNEENDFNVYAEKIFTEPAVVTKLAQGHELIRRKLEFVRAAYVEIDPRMTEVFDKLGLM